MNWASFPWSASSKFGPTVALEPAGPYVWQLEQGGCAVVVKISLPASALPLEKSGSVSCGTEPVTFSGVGGPPSPPPQPPATASAQAHATSASGWVRAIGRQAYPAR